MAYRIHGIAEEADPRPSYTEKSHPQERVVKGVAASATIRKELLKLDTAAVATKLRSRVAALCTSTMFASCPAWLPTFSGLELESYVSASNWQKIKHIFGNPTRSLGNVLFSFSTLQYRKTH